MYKLEGMTSSLDQDIDSRDVDTPGNKLCELQTRL